MDVWEMKVRTLSTGPPESQLRQERQMALGVRSEKRVGVSTVEAVMTSKTPRNFASVA